MDHAEVIERLDDAFVGPGKLASIETDHSIEGQELRRHLMDCPTCQAEVKALELTAVGMDAATPDTLRAPAEARGRILAAVAANGVPRGAAAQLETEPTPIPTRPAEMDHIDHGEPTPIAITRGPGRAGFTAPAHQERRISFGWLALAAAALVLVFVGGAVLGPILGMGTSAPDADGDLPKIVAATERVLAAEGHQQATLYTADGAPGGIVLTDPATTELVVTSGALDPAAGTYWCYLVRDQVRTRIGVMHFTKGAAYWAGKVAEPPDVGSAGDAFVVTLEGTSGAPTLSGTFED